MFDFRLKVFHTVARRLNFTKAAAELYISQPAVTRHIHALEHHFNSRLFERKGNKIQLTPAGILLYKHAQQLFNGYREMEYEMNALTETRSGSLHLGASTTIAQYILPDILARFHQASPQIKVKLITGNTEQIEEALLRQEIQLGMIEGKTRNTEINYQHFLDDEIVLVENNQNPPIPQDSIEAAALPHYPLLIREPGSGTRQVIEHALARQKIKIENLQIEMQLGATESIKSYLLQAPCIAFLSIHAILKDLRNQELRIVDIHDLTISRPLYYIQKQGAIDALSTSFIRFANQRPTKR